MTIDAHKLHNRSRDRNEDCLIVAMRVANPLLRVLSMVEHALASYSVSQFAKCMYHRLSKLGGGTGEAFL